MDGNTLSPGEAAEWLSSIGVLASEVPISYRRRVKASRRLERAKTNLAAARGRAPSVRALAARELFCAIAEAEEWGVIGRAGRS